MAWPVSGNWEARTAGVTTVKKAWADGLDAMFNALWSGTRTVKALQADGTGYQAATAGAGDVVGSGYVKGKRLRATGTSIVVGDWSLDATWGGGTVDAVSGDDSMGWVKITAGGGGGLAINPIATLTFKDGTWTTAPRAMASVRDTDGVFYPVSANVLATTLVLTMRGLPVNGKFYTINYLVLG